jgi:hypothetical protein
MHLYETNLLQYYAQEQVCAVKLIENLTCM